MYAFEGHGLEYMPFVVRRSLDLAGLRPSLADWQALPLAARQALAARAPNDAAEIDRFRAELLALLPNVARTNAVDFAARPWAGDAARDAIAARAKENGIDAARLVARWSALDDVARYALHRLADPKKDAAKLRAAIAELAP